MANKKRDNPTPITIRSGVRADVQFLTAIEAVCFDDPHDEGYFRQVMDCSKSVCKVIEMENCVVAYLVYYLWEKEIHIDSIAVMPELQRAGVGTALVTNALDRLTSNTCMTVDVNETLLPVQLFFKSLRFKATSIFAVDGDIFYRMVAGQDVQFARNWEPKNRISQYYV